MMKPLLWQGFAGVLLVAASVWPIPDLDVSPPPVTPSSSTVAETSAVSIVDTSVDVSTMDTAPSLFVVPCPADADARCGDLTTTTTPEPTTPEQVVVTGTAERAVDVGAGPPAGTAVEAATLPVTGTAPGWLVLLGALLAVAGALLVLLSRTGPRKAAASRSVTR
ncbi:hypothetical protein AB0A74_00955 [Saccharothrix sp. NPDC042600]|uniref:hypothetical protein n=1 Tax=Saccharothrix TaxID=2071 RepID=UPI0033EAB0B5|nr:hypothetical protein GCM10017745_48930 [Saccharothrix mutabilis subsp. capreolus]